jgi:hypothetical protein
MALVDKHQERGIEDIERGAPPIVTVFRGPDGIHHARCGRRIEFRGSRGGVEFDFYCLSCREHVTLPDAVLARIPDGPSAG